MSDLTLKAGDRIIDLSTPRVMGILNATPDSFSDGGHLQIEDGSGVFRVSVDKALWAAELMVADGAVIIDIGGESTRPGASPVSEQEEIDRVLPLVEAICERLEIVVSVDTSSPRVMQLAIEAGAGFVNDVRALAQAGAMEVLSSGDTSVCLMHMRGKPQNMQQNIEYSSVVDEIYAYLDQRIAVCEQAGIARSRLIVDPGFGFGKTLNHNYELLHQLSRFKSLGLPIMVGISRKSMLGNLLGRPVEQRLGGCLAATVHALLGGASIVRTHDVAATVDAIKVHCAVMRA